MAFREAELGPVEFLSSWRDRQSAIERQDTGEMFIAP